MAVLRTYNKPGLVKTLQNKTRMNTREKDKNILWQNDSAGMRDVKLDGRDGRGLSPVSGRRLNLNPSSGRGRAGLVEGRALVPAGILGLGLGNGDHGAALVVVDDLNVVTGAKGKAILQKLKYF